VALSSRGCLRCACGQPALVSLRSGCSVELNSINDQRSNKLNVQLYSNLPTEFSVRLESTETPDPGPSLGNRSFKLASEVALMIVFLFQCHPRRLQEHAESLLPLMVQVQWQFLLR
jgi:hypothetical protein